MFRHRSISAFRHVLAPAVLGAAFAAGIATGAREAHAGGELGIISLGGTFQEAQSKHWFKPFGAANDVKVIESSGYNYAKLKVMIESGNPEADLIDISADTTRALGEAGLLEPIDWSKIPAECQTGIPAEMKLSYAFPTFIWAMVMAYNTQKFPEGKAPRTWADFWDVAKFPGKRASVGATRPPVEQAALAINGDLAKLYPIDLRAAFDKINALKGNLLFTDSYAQVVQYLADGEADMIIIPNGRIPPLLKANKPVAINWNQYLEFPNFFGIPKGAPNKDNAMKFLAYVCKPEILAKLAEPTNYGPINADAFAFVPPEVAKDLPGNPAIAKFGRLVDPAWLAAARPEIAKEWTKMSAR